jgi:pimeloyl-ACP methyl ester carboxylesterase
MWPLLAAALSVAAVDSPAPAPCPIDGVEGEALCGSLEVPEDRARPEGRRIALRVVVLRARGPDPAPEALVFLRGGPGEAVIREAARLGRELDELRNERDILLIDPRGTGESNPLPCDLWSGGVDLSALIPLPAVERCRRELEPRADLRRYTTIETVADLEAVRAWLGYPRLDLIGGSYGTRLAQVYARRYPERVRTIVLRAVARFGDQAPLQHARHGQRALDLLAAECAADPACARAFPRFSAEVGELLDRLDKTPASVEVRHPATDDTVRVTLTRSAAAEVIRFWLYRQERARQLPLLVHRAVRGHLEPLAAAIVGLRAELPRAMELGLWLSATCADGVATIPPELIPAASAGTFLGDTRVREHMAACAAWPHDPAPAEFHEPLRADVPTLIFSGDRDPVTPPENAAEVARRLPRALNLVQPFGAHAGLDACVQGLIARFVRAGSIDGLDTSCLGAEKPTDFAIEPASP